MIMMNNNLRVFISVAEKGSFTATAEELFISQPAVSRSINDKKSAELSTSPADFWRRRRDLNPRDGCPPYTLSRGASSTT